MQGGNRHLRPHGGFKPLILAILLPSGDFHAPRQQEQFWQKHGPAQTFRVDVDLVTVGVPVTDHKTRAIKGLVAKDFEIYEDEKPQKSSFFSAQEQPISLPLWLDKNHRMEKSGKLGEAKRALLALLEASHADTKGGLVSALKYH